MFSYDDKIAGFAAKEHIAEFKDGVVPVQFMVMGCNDFDAEKTVDDFTRSQMWDCPDSDRILQVCHYQMIGTDMMAGALPIF